MGMKAKESPALLWRDRALEAENKLARAREVLLDVDALLNMGKRQAQAVAARFQREERTIPERVEAALLETTLPAHCTNWAYGCVPEGCSCSCGRCR